MPAADVLELLRGEIAEAAGPLAEALAALADAEAEDTAFAEAVDQCAAQMEGIRAAAEAGGLAGLEAFAGRIGEGLLELALCERSVRQQLKDELTALPGALLAHLDQPSETSAEALANLLSGDAWPTPLEEESRTALTTLLAADGEATGVEEEETESRLERATAGDVDLRPSEDVNAEVLAAFLDDAPQQAATLSENLQRLAGEADTAAVEPARRVAHTIKGAASVVGIAGIANLTHYLEDLLDRLTGLDRVPQGGLGETLVSAADCLEGMVDAVTGVDDPPAEAVTVLQEVLDWGRRIRSGDLELESAASPEPDPGAEAALPAKETPAAEAAPPAQPADSAREAALRVPLRTIDELVRSAGELSISTGQLEAGLTRFRQIERALTEQDRVLQQRLFELEDLVDVRDVVSARLHHGGSGADEDADFDPLEMDAYNELHSCSRALGEALADWRELRRGLHEELAALRTRLAEHKRLNTDLQDTVLATRLVPARNLSARLHRAVRQAARSSGRQAGLEIEGEDLLLDAEVLDGLADPLLHLLRNAVDHGIEPPEDRQAADKPAAGTIRLVLEQVGNRIRLTCSDDGRGVDLSAVRRRAEERGLVADGAELDEAALIRLILLPGFSTRAEVTRLSGRGVGLDVVNERVRALGGNLDVRSRRGEGCTFTLELPATLVTVHVLLVEAADQVLAIPSGDLERIPTPDAGTRVDHDGSLRFRMEEAEYPLRPLAELIGRRSGSDQGPVLLVTGEERPEAIAVERLLGSQEVVIKGFGAYLPRVPGVLGGAILGDGTVAPVLDLRALIREPWLTGDVPADAVTETPAAQLPQVLVVDDSLSVRRSLEQLLGDCGYEVALARDGVEAVEQIARRRPDVVIADLEMPRMNGLELTERLRREPDTRELPVIMLTSRTMVKHQRQAERVGVDAYLGKPYQETELLGQVEACLGRDAAPPAASAAPGST